MGVTRGMDRFKKLHEALKQSGLLNQILGPDGEIQPTDSAIRFIADSYPEIDTTSAGGAAQIYRLAQAQTLIELAERHGIEMD